jgi:hypothetical protein
VQHIAICNQWDHSIVTISLTLNKQQKHSSNNSHADKIGIKPGELVTIPAASRISAVMPPPNCTIPNQASEVALEESQMSKYYVERREAY